MYDARGGPVAVAQTTGTTKQETSSARYKRVLQEGLGP